MTHSNSPAPNVKAFSTGGRRRKRPATTAALIIAVLVGGYSMFRPAINQATGWNLPAIATEQPEVQPVGEAELARAAEVARAAEMARAAEVARAAELASAAKAAPAAASNIPETTDAASESNFESNSKSDPKSEASAASLGSSESLKYGLLREIGPDRFLSPAGLLYGPGSREGHRLRHIERHTVDQVNRPGKHGVFDGGMETTLRIIDRAYEKAKVGRQTTKTTDQGRTVYTVDMGQRVGFVGGRDGNRQRKPMARRVRLVLDGNRVITAFPL